MDDLMNYYKMSLLNGLCEEYKSEWQGCHGDEEKLMRLALRQQSIPHLVTYAVNGRGVTKELLLSRFKDYVNGHVFNNCDCVDGYTYSMFVDYPYDNDIRLEVDVSVYMWCRDTYVTVPMTKCPLLYVSNHSDIHLSLDGYSTVIIYLFDDSKVTIEESDELSKVNVYSYSEDTVVEQGKHCLGNVRVFEKQLRL